MSDFGTAFSDGPQAPQPDPTSGGLPIHITSRDIEQANAAGSRALAARQPGGEQVIHVGKVLPYSPQQQAAQRYNVALSDPDRGEQLFVGVARQSKERTESHQHWTIFSQVPQQRQIQIYNFSVEITDDQGAILEHVPVEVRGERITGALPNEGSPVAVYGRRDRTGLVQTYKVINLVTKSSLQVTPESRDCLIATAAYGSSDAPQVVRFRRFRDEQLLPSPVGRLFVRFYYWWSPPVARRLARLPGPRRAVRALLDRLVAALDRREGE